ncbi:MAG TPA: tetratricopeptide repeat protein [Bdellovibrionota bacterium]|nr:tetratricopeptide repeat protein [Bdellovibrionota bacterium]
MTETRFADLERLLKVYKKNPHSKIFAPLAELYRKNGLVDEALSLCEKGLAFHPDYIGGKVAYGRALVDAGEFERAQVVLEEVIMAAPENYLSLSLLLRCYEKRGLEEKRCEILERLKLLNPALKVEKKLEANEAVSLEATFQEFEMKELKGVFSESTDNEDSEQRKKYYTLSLAQVYERQGHFKKALEIYENLKLLHPEREDFYKKAAELKNKIQVEVSKTQSQESHVSILKQLLHNIQEK